jgi:hypothetical protein
MQTKRPFKLESFGSGSFRQDTSLRALTAKTTQLGPATPNLTIGRTKGSKAGLPLSFNRQEGSGERQGAVNPRDLEALG